MNPGEFMLLPGSVVSQTGFLSLFSDPNVDAGALKPAHAHDGLVLLHIAVDALVQAQER